MEVLRRLDPFLQTVIYRHLYDGVMTQLKDETCMTMAYDDYRSARNGRDYRYSRFVEAYFWDEYIPRGWDESYEMGLQLDEELHYDRVQAQMANYQHAAWP
jgi:hypothetical protein